RAITLDEDDRLISAMLTGGSDNVIIATAYGSAVRFCETEVRAMGRTAFGVRGIKLREGDRVIGPDREVPGCFYLTVTKTGYGKLTESPEFSLHNRGGYGITAHNLTDKTGELMAIKAVDPEKHDIILMTGEGVMIRIKASDIRICGRASQGVILVRTDSEKGG